MDADKINVKFAHKVLILKADIENNIADNLFEENYMLTNPFNIEEITCVYKKLKKQQTNKQKRHLGLIKFLMKYLNIRKYMRHY